MTRLSPKTASYHMDPMPPQFDRARFTQLCMLNLINKLVITQLLVAAYSVCKYKFPDCVMHVQSLDNLHAKRNPGKIRPAM